MASSRPQTGAEVWNVGLPSDFTKTLFETGNFSDLIMKTPTHAFNVHQSFVCSRSPPLAHTVSVMAQHGDGRHVMFDIGDNRNLRNQHMKVEDTIRVVLRWIYGLPNPQMCLTENATDDQILENLVKLLAVQNAALMCVVQDLLDYTSNLINKHLDECRPIGQLMQMCILLYQQPASTDKAAETLVGRFEEVVRDTKAWPRLKREKKLLKKIDEMRRIGARVPQE